MTNATMSKKVMADRGMAILKRDFFDPVASLKTRRLADGTLVKADDTNNRSVGTLQSA